MDFWRWVAIIELGLIFIGVVLVGVRVWTTARQTRAINRMSATAEVRTQRILARMDDRHSPRPLDHSPPGP